MDREVGAAALLLVGEADAHGALDDGVDDAAHDGGDEEKTEEDAG